MNIVQNLKTSVLALLILALICCGVYPLIVWTVSQVIFPHQANGSLVRDASGQPIASSLIGQNFAGASYFHPRPSAAGANGYDGSSSSGSNLGPTSTKLIDAVKQRVADYRQQNNLAENQAVPADAVTASASGLDPHISVKNALLQLPRVAQSRGLSEDELKKMVVAHTAEPALGILGEPAVNVVTLNLALDQKLKR